MRGDHRRRRAGGGLRCALPVLLGHCHVIRSRNVELGDLWLPGVRFESTLAASEQLLVLPGFHPERVKFASTLGSIESWSFLLQI